MPKPDPARLRRSAACAVIFNPEGHLLLHRRSDNGQWALPGGAIEIGETAAQTIIREVLEETGYHVEVLRIVGIYSDPAHTTMHYPNGDISSYVAICYECRVTSGAPALSDETIALQWFPPTALPQNTYPGHLPRIQDALLHQPAAFSR